MENTMTSIEFKAVSPIIEKLFRNIYAVESLMKALSKRRAINNNEGDVEALVNAVYVSGGEMTSGLLLAVRELNEAIGLEDYIQKAVSQEAHEIP